MLEVELAFIASFFQLKDRHPFFPGAIWTEDVRERERVPWDLQQLWELRASLMQRLFGTWENYDSSFIPSSS